MKRYVTEEGTTVVRRLLARGLRATVRISETEVASALARRAREGSIPSERLASALEALRNDMSALLVVEVSPRVVARSVMLLQRHPLRAGDALQLSAAFEIREMLDADVEIVAYDERLLAAATLEGLATSPG